MLYNVYTNHVGEKTLENFKKETFSLLFCNIFAHDYPLEPQNLDWIQC